MLSHGTKFTPTTTIDYFDAKQYSETFTRKLKIIDKFANTNIEDESLCRHKSTKPIQCNNEELLKITKMIEDTQPSNIRIPDNLPKDERKALQELKNNISIVIKEADKGGGLVIMNKDFYHDKLIMKDHLNNQNTYKTISDEDDTKTFQEIKNLITVHDKCLTKNEKSYITEYDWESSHFYIRPKVHKCKSILNIIKESPNEIISIENPEDLTGRPIVAGTISPTRHLGDLIGKILKPIVPMQKSYIKDDWDYIKKLPVEMTYDSKLFGCDISSLYTSIPHDLGLQATEYWIIKNRTCIPDRFSTKFILDSIRFLLENNNFSFNNQMYKQIEGTAMGSTFASFYACLTIGYLEEHILFSRIDNTFIHENAQRIKNNYKRYMDDGIIFLPIEVEENLFLKILNNLHPSIKFTLEESYRETHYDKNMECLNFLDIKVILYKNRIISTDISYKSTNSHDYLHFDSFHPRHTINNIPYNLAKRIIVFVTDEQLMETRLDELRFWLTKCEYPNEIIDRAYHNARLQGPANKPIPKENIIPFVTTHASNFEFSGTINTARELLKSIRTPELKNRFEKCEIVNAEKQPKNILRILTSEKFKKDVKISGGPGLFAECTDIRCNLCHKGYIQTCTSFVTSNNKIWEIRTHINCNSINVLYFLVCNKCNGATTYTGKTKTSLRTRMNNHISDCRTGNTTDKFDIHVKKCCIENDDYAIPFFKIYAFMALKSEHKLNTYEKYLHRQKFDTMNS